MSELPGDDDLIRRFVVGGDRAAFESLVRRHALRIRRLLYGLFGGNREDMEDAEQEVIVALFRALPRFGFRSSFPTFLYRLTRNRAIDVIRRRERERRSLRRLAGGLAPEGAQHPEEMAVAEVARDQALSLLATLPAGQRAVVVLREVEDLSIEEIARVMGVPTGTVKSRLHRARRRIEKALARDERGAGGEHAGL